MKTILTETRKFGLHGTFAQQFTGQGMNTEMKTAIIGNSHIKMTGNNGVKDLRVMSAEMGVSVEELQSLKQGQFFMKSGASPAVRVCVPMLSKKDRMTFEQWAEVRAEQIKKYYRPILTEQRYKPQHTTRNPAQKIEVTAESLAGAAPQKIEHATLKKNKKKFNHERIQKKSAFDELSGVKPHLKPRGKDLKNPFD